MMFLGLRTAIYCVADLGVAKAWYAATLGVAPYFDEPFYVGFGVGGYELGLLPIEASHQTPETTLTYWGVANAHEALNHLLASGATIHEPVADVGGGIRLGVVVTPSGNLFGFIENPHFSLT